MQTVGESQTSTRPTKRANGIGDLAKGTALTASARAAGLLIGAVSSIFLTRMLGPQGKGVYTVAALLPSLVVAFTNLGLGQSAAYYAAQERFRAREVFGNTALLTFAITILGMLIGLGVASFGGDRFFPGIPLRYLLLALVFLPLSHAFTLGQYILLGFRRLKEYNLASLLEGVLFLLFMLVALGPLHGGVSGALLASALAWLVTDCVALAWARRASGGISFRINPEFIRLATGYGAKTHIGNVLWMLNYRVDVLLVNGYLGPVAVGFYSLAVSLVEKLWLVSQAASTVLFPWIASEKDERRRAELTPFVVRTVLVITGSGALSILLLGRWLVITFFTKEFLPAVRPLQLLLPGIVALAVGRILANDLAARGRVTLNNYAGLVTASTNIGLNLLLVPGYGIQGAALASTVSYTASFVLELLFYCRVTGNSPAGVMLPRGSDLAMWWKAALATGAWVRRKVRAA